MTGLELRDTYSVCPVCRERVPARHILKDNRVYLSKTCPRHGEYASVIWKNRIDMALWRGNVPAIAPGENTACPGACGLCDSHRQETCCVLLEVTSRCNLACKFCFENSHPEEDPPLQRVKDWISDLARPGQTLVQLSGGEPCMRDDLADIIAHAKEAGCRYVQLNTNGIRLAEEDGFARELADAGLSFVFMQFDGTKDEIYRTLRGRDLFYLKEKAIDNCAAQNIGVVLVPTLVPGVNTGEIGNILRYGVSASPAVRGVHYQPATFMGRIPWAPEDKDRFTLDELLAELALQSDGAVGPDTIKPSQCDHPLCGFHGDFVVQPDGTLRSLSAAGGNSAGENTAHTAEKSRRFVARRWQRLAPVGGQIKAGVAAEQNRSAAPLRSAGSLLPAAPLRSAEQLRSAGQFRPVKDPAPCCCSTSPAIYSGETTFDGFLEQVRGFGFTVTAMAFQDAWNIDLERLRQCSLHVYKDGRFIPFCSYYLGAS
jgi:uncharacterized radical SAM superfamily Fe-S cluster-containing enzyme